MHVAEADLCSRFLHHLFDYVNRMLTELVASLEVGGGRQKEDTRLACFSAVKLCLQRLPHLPINASASPYICIPQRRKPRTARPLPDSPPCRPQTMDTNWTRSGSSPSPQLLRLLTSTADYALVLLRMLELMAGGRTGPGLHRALCEGGWAWATEGGLRQILMVPQDVSYVLDLLSQYCLSILVQRRCHSCSWKAAT